MITARRSSQKRVAEIRHISMPPVISSALTVLAERAGHGNASRIVQELITREAIYQLGPGWANRCADDAEEQEAKTA